MLTIKTENEQFKHVVTSLQLLREQKIKPHLHLTASGLGPVGTHCWNKISAYLVQDVASILIRQQAHCQFSIRYHCKFSFTICHKCTSLLPNEVLWHIVKLNKPLLILDCYCVHAGQSQWISGKVQTRGMYYHMLQTWAVLPFGLAEE